MPEDFIDIPVNEVKNISGVENIFLANFITPNGSHLFKIKLYEIDGEVGLNFIKVAATAPNAPTGLTASTQGASSIQLHWTAPISDGGSPITGYKIERSTSGGTFETIVADSEDTNATYTDTGLTSETTYEYRVSARNIVGTGTASTIASATTDASGGNVYTERQMITELTTQVNGSSRRVGMLIYLPVEFRNNPVADYPYLFWCHGSGEGATISDTAPLNFDGLRSGEGFPKFINNDGEKPYIIIMPQLPQWQGSQWDNNIVTACLNAAKSVVPEINVNRVAISGWSNGRSAWAYLTEFPTKVTVSIPMAVNSGFPNNSTLGCTVGEGNAAIWAFHGANDSLSYAAIENAVNYIKACHPNTYKVKMSLYTGVGHNCVTQTINLTGGPVEPGYTPYPDSGETIDDFLLENY